MEYAKGQITTTERLKQLTPDEASRVYFTSADHMYEMRVLRHNVLDVTCMLTPVLPAAGADVPFAVKYSTLCLDGRSGSYKVFALRSRAEQYVASLKK